MKRTITILFAVVLSTVMLSAQAVSLDRVRSDIIQFSTTVSSIDCDFVQTKESSLLAEAIVSSGHMSYRRPGHLEWNYLKPNSLIFVADGNTVTIGKGDQSETVSGNQNRFIKEMAQMIIGNIDGSILTNDKLFKSEFALVDDQIRVDLIPQKKDIQKMWSRLVLFYEQNSMKATRFEMHETSGDLTVVSFTNIKYGFSE